MARKHSTQKNHWQFKLAAIDKKVESFFYNAIIRIGNWIDSVNNAIDRFFAMKFRFRFRV